MEFSASLKLAPSFFFSPKIWATKNWKDWKKFRWNKKFKNCFQFYCHFVFFSFVFFVFFVLVNKIVHAAIDMAPEIAVIMRKKTLSNITNSQVVDLMESPGGILWQRQNVYPSIKLFVVFVDKSSKPKRLLREKMGDDKRCAGTGETEKTKWNQKCGDSSFANLSP